MYQYLSEPHLRIVSHELDIPLTRLFAIATFYKAFRLVPRGRHEISLCLGTACHVRGGTRVKDAIERGLGIKAGEPLYRLDAQLLQAEHNEAAASAAVSRLLRIGGKPLLWLRPSLEMLSELMLSL